jgi:hypothetical protein
MIASQGARRSPPVAGSIVPRALCLLLGFLLFEGSLGIPLRPPIHGEQEEQEEGESPKSTPLVEGQRRSARRVPDSSEMLAPPCRFWSDPKSRVSLSGFPSDSPPGASFAKRNGVGVPLRC